VIRRSAKSIDYKVVPPNTAPQRTLLCDSLRRAPNPGKVQRGRGWIPGADAPGWASVAVDRSLARSLR
jgi:hypothetical protein